MSNIYTDPWGYDGDVSFIKRNPCGCQDERSEEQIKIDDKQDADIKAEVQRSQAVDAEQSAKLTELDNRINNLDNNQYYETDE